MLESRQTGRSGRNKREQCYSSGENTRTKRHVRPERRLVTNSADMPLLESSTSSGDSSRKVGASRNTRIRGNWFVRWTTLSLTSSPVKVLFDIGSSVNLLNQETIQSFKQRPSLTKEHNPVIPYAGSPMNILGKFDADNHRPQTP